jgi:SAM-dependent methyltransferase
VHVLHLIPDWRVAVDEAMRVLRPGGALVASFPTDNRAVGAVAEYLAGRATARELSPVPVRTVWTLGEAIDHVERQLFSWSWPYTAALAAALADDLRGWAARAGVALDTAHEAATAVRCWAFELR